MDVESGETCADLADFPVSNYGAVGANLNGTPIVCGGYSSGTYYQACYKLTNAGWQEFASMNEKRAFAAGIVFKNKFNVFGGSDGFGSRLQTSEIISIDGAVEYGPELPRSSCCHW